MFVKINSNKSREFFRLPQTIETAGERLPRRKDLAGKTAETLKDWIRAGVLKGVLPGEPRLKMRLGVSRETLRLALKRLTQEGWVSSPAKGTRRQIPAGLQLNRKYPGAGRLTVTILSPQSREHRGPSAELENVRALLVENGFNLRFISSDNFQSKHVGRQLEDLVRTYPSSVWGLCSTGEAVQRWFARSGLPVLVYGLPFAGVNLSFVAADWERAAFHACIRLLNHGHQIIGLLEGAKHSPEFPAVRLGLKRALSVAGLKGRLEVFKDDGSATSVAGSLESAFCGGTQPTALVLAQTAHLLKCYSWLASRGIKVPADISIVTLGRDRWFNDLYPPVCHYQPDYKRISQLFVKRVLDLERAGHVTGKPLMIRMKYVRGATLSFAPHVPEADAKLKQVSRRNFVTGDNQIFPQLQR